MIKNWKYILVLGASLSFTTAFGQSVKDAQRSIDLERYNEATKTLSGINSDEASLYLGDAYLRTGKLNEATAAYAKGYAANPKSALAMVGAGKAALLKGNTAEAEGLFEAAIKASKKKDPNVYIQIGQAYVDAKVKEPAKGIEYVNEALKITKNNSAPAYVVLGDLHLLRTNGGGEAATAFERATQIDGKLAKAHAKRGKLFVQARNYNEAQASYQAAITADPNFAPVYRDLGEMYYFVGKYDQAAENFKKFISMAEDSPETRMQLASFLFLTKDYEGSIREARAALQQSPENTAINSVLAKALFEAGKTDEALAAMDTYFKGADQSKFIASDYSYYGQMLSKAGKGAEAQAQFDKAIQMDPDNAELQDDVAAFYIKQKEYPKAIALYKAKIAAKPSRTDNFKLAEAYFAAKQYAEADEIYAALLKEVPNYTPAVLRRAEIAEAQDKDQGGAAKPYYEEYVKLIMEDPAKASSPSYKGGLMKANYYLGYQAYKSKDFTTARKYWTEVKRLDPTNKDVDNALKNLDVASKSARK
ncbi:tetratricopeptide repeat protein [Adhaeribacter aquaticus]|uniref:tetratricopeptide repeat protein n=1 Tax=Adhaeribacter aquaticus TaxID=299567 RepID=UPI0004189A43|nr:tetratricopeptide repeat protein [Adhaeribacter aquaticus]